MVSSWRVVVSYNWPADNGDVLPVVNKAAMKSDAAHGGREFTIYALFEDVRRRNQPPVSLSRRGRG